MEKDKKPVEIELLGDDKFKISYNNPMLEDHILDYPSVHPEDRGGQMRSLLSASALGCFAGSVYFTLIHLGAKVKSLKGSSFPTIKQNIGQLFPKITAIDLRVEIGIDDEDIPKLEEVKKMFKNGCFITGSISPCISVNYTIERV